MVKGIGVGLISGGFVGTVVLSMLSLYAPLPQDRIDAAPKLDVEAVEPDAVAPEETSESTVPAQNTATTTANVDTAEQSQSVAQSTDAAPALQPAAPQLDASNAANADSPTAIVASTNDRAAGVVPDTPVTQAAGNDEIIIAGADPAPAPLAQIDPGAQASAVDATPSVEATTQDTTATVQPSQLATETVTGTEKLADVEAPAPQVVEAEEVAEEETARPKLPTITTPDVIEVASADTPITLPQVGSSVVTNRLPSVGGATAEAEAPAEEAAAAEQSAEDVGALRAYGQQVEGTEGKSLFGIVLIDSGEDGIPREDLMKLAVPVTIAIDPTADNATQIMEDYRAAGVEVVAIANELPTASSPSDVAVAVEAYFANLPQSIGIMDPLDGRIQSNRSLLQPVLGAIRSSGHGLITYDRGLNTAQQAARREDIPAATVFRILDAELEEGPKIKRYMDRAAFNANRDGAVVVVGRSYPATVQAIVEWVLEKKESGIAMVPVSAVMLADEAS